VAGEIPEWLPYSLAHAGAGAAFENDILTYTVVGNKSEFRKEGRKGLNFKFHPRPTFPIK